MGTELLETTLSAQNDLIVNPALPLRGACPFACAQGLSHAGTDEIVQDHERRLGNLDLPGDELPGAIRSQEDKRAVEVMKVVEVLVLAALGVPVPACQSE